MVSFERVPSQGDLMKILERQMDEAEACGQDGSAHLEWMRARQIPMLETEMMKAMLSTTLSIDQFFRIAFEYGYSMGFNHKNQIGLELDDDR